MGLNTQYQPAKQLGIILDLPPEEVAAEFYTGGLNIQFGDGCTQRVVGYSTYGGTLPAGESPIFAGSVSYQGVNYWLWFTATKIWVTDGVTHYDITPVGGLSPTTAGSWTFDVLGGLPVFNNPSNPPMYWNLNTANKALVLPGWPTGARCQSLRVLKYSLVALNITDAGINYPSQVWWSAGAQAGSIPQEWLPTASNDAGDSILGDSDGQIIDGCQLRDQLMIYKGDSTYVMQYVAGQYVFAFRKVFPSVGIQSLNCACEIDGYQFVFTGQDLIKHDGQNYDSVVDFKVKKALIASIDPNNIKLCTVVPRVVDRQIWVCFPIVNTLNLGQALIIDTDDLFIGIRSLPSVTSVARGVITPVDATDSWESDPKPWSDDVTIWVQYPYSPTTDSLMMTLPVIGANPGKLYAVGLTNSADGLPISSTIERLSMRVGDGIYHAMLTQIVPKIEGVTGDVVMIRLGSQNYFEEPITWLEPQPFTIGVTKGISQIIDGRYLSIQFTANTVNMWKLFGYFLKLARGGEY